MNNLNHKINSLNTQCLIAKRVIPKLLILYFSIGALLLIALTACTSEPEEMLQEQVVEAPTATSTSIPTPLPTSTNEPIVPVLAGECAHTYFPAVEDRKLVYRSDSLKYPEYTIDFVDVSEQAFAIQVDMRIDNGEDLSVVFNWTCSSEGLLSNYFLEGLTGLQGLRFDMQEASGVTILGESKMVLGTKWGTEYLIHEPGTVESAAGVLSVDTSVSLSHSVAEIEPVSVVAGEFPESYRVDTVGIYKMSLLLGEDAVQEEEIDIAYHTWYVENVGMVRQEFVEGWSMEPSDETSVIELIAID